MSADPVPDLNAVLTALAERLRPASLLIKQEDAPEFLGVSRAAFFRLKAEPSFPRPVAVKGAGVLYRRADLLKWSERLKPSRN